MDQQLQKFQLLNTAFWNLLLVPFYLRVSLICLVYGVTKVTGELLCSYYHKKFNVDVRGLRYPGIISTETLPGGGTTDYAVAIFYDAIKYGKYECYLKEDTQLPMMYMSDALKASIDLMESEIAARGICYNLAAWSFSPSQLSKLIEAHVPNFSISYKIDPVRQVSLVT